MDSNQIILSKEEEFYFCERLRDVKKHTEQDDEFRAHLDELLAAPPYERRLSRLSWILVRNVEDARDFAQDVSLKVALNIFDKFTPNYERRFGNFFAWLEEIARNTYYDRLPNFRASKDQIVQAQKILKDCGVYAGEQTGKLDENTLAGLRNYQLAENIKVTGRLNKVTLEKMGIELIEKQLQKPKFVDIEVLLKLQDRGADPETSARRSELFERIEKLPPNRRFALERILEGYSLREVEAEMKKLGMHCSHVTIGNWVRDELKDFFSDTKVLVDWNHPQGPRVIRPVRV